MLNFVLNDYIELLEIMSDGRVFHSLAVVGTKLFPKVLDECRILRNWLLCLREQRVLWMIIILIKWDVYDVMFHFI